MRVLTIDNGSDCSPLSATPTVITVGSFDGVHRGHLHLLAELRARARLAEGESVVVTFAEHPRRRVEPLVEIRELTSLIDKQLLIEKEGIDTMVVLPFDETMRGLSAREFVRDVLVGWLGMAELVVGYNHRLGRDREGGVEQLRELGREYGFRVHEASKFSIDGIEKVSSTAIREALAHGDHHLAEKMLGRKLES